MNRRTLISGLGVMSLTHMAKRIGAKQLEFTADIDGADGAAQNSSRLSINNDLRNSANAFRLDLLPFLRNNANLQGCPAPFMWRAARLGSMQERGAPCIDPARQIGNREAGKNPERRA